MNRLINTEYGPVSGVWHNGCTAYFGIPFAEPPVGPLAFRHPVKPRPWEGIYAADRGSANPIQRSGEDGYTSRNNSQDCLYLNIYVPEGMQAPAPVLVWIYGGAFSVGGAGQQDDGAMIYDMSRFAVDSQTIVVTFNYRLNVYGFLNLHELSPRFDVNCGLYDQIMALRFVRHNIATFGGDPGRITAFGQSAGAASILALMCMPDAQGLFKRCIIQSPCVDHFFTPEESLKNAEMYMRALGANHPEEILSLPEDRIIEAAEKYERRLMLRGDIRCAFSPVIDGRFLPAAPVEAVKERPLPMLIGNTLKEGDFFLEPYPTAVLPFIAGFLHVKVPRGEDRYRHRASDGLTQKVFLEPMERLLRDYDAPVWKYEYRHGENLGHIGELPTLFDATDDPTGLQMRRIWGQFARTGRLDWPEYGISQYVYGFD